MSIHDLRQRRDTTEGQWARFADGKKFSRRTALPESICSSWQRSADCIDLSRACAPLEDSHTTANRWQNSLLKNAAAQEHGNMAQLVNDGNMVAAIADTAGQLLWTSSSSHMRQRAESVNFMAGARWDEESVGTNAVGLALALRRAVTVFSNEHYLPSVHDWVCYAAPIIHPKTQDCVGILDMSTSWQRHSPLGQAAVIGMAHSLAAGLPDPVAKADLEIYALGQPRVVYQGQTLHLQQRQLEILCLLALNPEGLTLQQFHAVLYGDSPVSAHTLKSELSHLRRMLGGNIGSRPYRLQTPVWADFIEIWQALHRQQSDEALGLYRGPLIPKSTSPELEEWRRCIDAVMSEALDSCNDSATLIKQLTTSTGGSELIRERLSEILS